MLKFGRVWGINIGKGETFPFSGPKLKGWDLLNLLTYNENTIALPLQCWNLAY